MKIVSLGEILLRLSPPNYQTLNQSMQLDCQFGGSELNVLATLAQLGHQVSLLSAVPDNDLGRMTEQFLFSKQIGHDRMIRKGERLGLYFYQKGFSVRSSRVTYDRKYSAFWESQLKDYCFDDVFKDADWFHVSGITPALTEEMYEMTHFLMEKAKREGLTISFDLNFRESLWESFQEAREKLSILVKLADVCIGIEPLMLPGNQTDLKDELGLKRPYDDLSLLKQVVIKLAQEYNLKTIAFTQREMDHTSVIQVTAYLYHQGEFYKTAKNGIQVLDRVGTGDAFTAGLIYGLLETKNAHDILATAMACFKYKHTIEGDINIMTKHDIEMLITSDEFDIKR